LNLIQLQQPRIGWRAAGTAFRGEQFHQHGNSGRFFLAAPGNRCAAYDQKKDGNRSLHNCDPVKLISFPNVWRPVSKNPGAFVLLLLKS
jgi:hypothetical protein